MAILESDDPAGEPLRAVARSLPATVADSFVMQAIGGGMVVVAFMETRLGDGRFFPRASIAMTPDNWIDLAALITKSLVPARKDG